MTARSPPPPPSQKRPPISAGALRFPAGGRRVTALPPCPRIRAASPSIPKGSLLRPARDTQSQPRRPQLGDAAGTRAAAPAHRPGSPVPHAVGAPAPASAVASAGTPPRTPSASPTQTAQPRTNLGTLCNASASLRFASCRRRTPAPTSSSKRLAGWITIPPPLPGAPRPSLDHDPAPGWITQRPPLKCFCCIWWFLWHRWWILRYERRL